MNAFASRLLLEQPDPPRKVGVGTVLKTDIAPLALLLIPGVLLGGGVFDHRLLPFALISVAFLALAFGMVAQQNAGARWALQFGIAAVGQVTRVEPGFRGSKIVTVHVDSPTGPTDATLVRSGAANVLVDGDVVQVMLDPQTHQVLLILGLLKPSPLYAPPSN